MFLFRNYWHRARMLRAERDLVLLPMWLFLSRQGDDGDYQPEVLPEGSAYSFYAANSNIENVSKRCSHDIKIRVPSFIPRPSRSEMHSYYLFGVPVPAGEDLVYISPADPMGEYILIPDNPRKLSEQCSVSARKFEYISVFAFTAGLGTNLFLIFWILYTIIK